MSDKVKVLLNGDIEFDPHSQKYIINAIKDMKYHNKFKDYLKMVIEASFEDPSMISNSLEFKNELLNMGVTPCAKEFFDKSGKSLAEMHKKVDAMYDMCLEMYTLVKFNRQYGLEESLNNMVIAQFLIEKQLKELAYNLGVPDMRVYKSQQISNIPDIADNALEYIINNHSDVANAIVIESTKQVINQVITDKQNNEPLKIEIEDIEKGETVDIKPEVTPEEYDLMSSWLDAMGDGNG